MRKKFPILLMAPCIAILLGLSIFPMAFSLWAAFQHWDVSSPNPVPEFVGLGNFQKILFDDPRFWNSLQVTLFISSISITAEFILGLGIALLMHRGIRGISVIKLAIVTPIMITPIIIGFTWKLLYHTTGGLLNYFLNLLGFQSVNWLGGLPQDLFSIIIVDVWHWTPFIFLILFAGLEGLIPDPFEAARVDGASRWDVFRYLTFPLLKNVMVVALFIRLIDCFKLFDEIWILTLGGPGLDTETMSLYAYFAGFRYWNMGYAASLAYMLLMVIAVLINIFARLLPTE